MQKSILIILLLLITWTSALGRSSYLNRGIGFGGSVGNPIFNYVMSFPFIDIEIGYGGSNGLNLSGRKINSKKYDLNLFALAALDLIFTIPLIEKLSIGLKVLGKFIHSTLQDRFNKHTIRIWV